MPAALLMSGSSTTSTSSTPARRPSRKVASLEYYDLLQIEPNASDAQIKKPIIGKRGTATPTNAATTPTRLPRFRN